ncbi:MAG: AAA family ATPase [Candidatus Kapabacteria bacterium]|nr:AAA family ATPase [Candidatus Kapabacteria bacterium]
MIKAFVFGKFLPFHNGHKALIEFALSKCEFLTILICCSDKENISDYIRSSWIQKTFEKEKSIEIRTFNYLESELPNTSLPSKRVSKAWASIFKKLFPDYSLLITSEEYGDYVANFINIQHIAFDIHREIIPVSATAFRNDIYTNWKYLPDSVKPDFVIKIVILGTESTGKTTLAINLSKYFNASLVLEAGREIISDSNSFSLEDLQKVATEHAKSIELNIIADSPIVIIDTDIYLTKSYSTFTFEKEFEISADIFNTNKADLYLYLNNDVAFIQDGTRMSKEKRDLLDISHRKVLKENDIEIKEITGTYDERFEKAVKHINKLIEMKNQEIKM